MTRKSKPLGVVTLVMFTLGVTSSASARALPPPPPEAPPAPRAEWIDFKENRELLVDHQKEVAEAPISIEEVGGKDKVEWKSPKAAEFTKNWPVVYVLNEKVKILEARFTISAATKEFLEKKAEGEPEVVGETTIGGTLMQFKKKFTIAAIKEQLAKHAGYLSVETESGNSLPKLVLYELATITWKWTVKEKGNPEAFKQELGKSKHNFYVLFAAPLKETVYLTLLDLATRGIAAEVPPPAEASAITGVWKGFSTVEGGVPSVHVRTYNPASETGNLEPKGKKIFEYYGEIVKAGKDLEKVYEEEITNKKRTLTCPLVPLQGLIETFVGRCGAWALALKNAFSTEGLASTEIGVEVMFGKGACEKVGACLMLVKTWKLGKKGAGELPFAAKETIDEEGLAGQGVKNPPPFFWDHAIIKVGPKGSSVLYDPSYGAGPFPGTEVVKPATEKSVLEELQNRSIDGFCAPTPPTECAKASEVKQGLVAEEAFEFP